MTLSKNLTSVGFIVLICKTGLELNDFWMSHKAKNAIIISFVYNSANFYCIPATYTMLYVPPK